MVRDDPKPPDDSGEKPKPNGLVGGSIPNRRICSLLDKKLIQVATHLMCSKNKNPPTKFVYFHFAVGDKGSIILAWSVMIFYITNSSLMIKSIV